jgi:hypothetical protein
MLASSGLAHRSVTLVTSGLLRTAVLEHDLVYGHPALMASNMAAISPPAARRRLRPG